MTSWARCNLWTWQSSSCSRKRETFSSVAWKTSPFRAPFHFAFSHNKSFCHLSLLSICLPSNLARLLWIKTTTASGKTCSFREVPWECWWCGSNHIYTNNDTHKKILLPFYYTRHNFMEHQVTRALEFAGFSSIFKYSLNDSFKFHKNHTNPHQRNRPIVI